MLNYVKGFYSPDKEAGRQEDQDLIDRGWAVLAGLWF